MSEQRSGPNLRAAGLYKTMQFNDMQDFWSLGTQLLPGTKAFFGLHFSRPPDPNYR
jgi:hypothetical protein